MGFFGIEKITQDDFKVLDRLFENFLKIHNRIYIFGAGQNGKGVYSLLRECGYGGVEAFVQSQLSFEESGKIIDQYKGIPIITTDELRRRYNKDEGIGLLLSVDEKYYEQVIPNLLFLGEDMFFVGRARKILTNHIRDIQSCSFQITDHCNLACYACNVAAPVAQKGFMEKESFRRDTALLRRAIGNRVIRIGVTGGEALLHPECLDFLQIARQTFPDCQIELLTNGILLGMQKDRFWNIMEELNVVINMTRYPIKYINFEYVEEMVKDHNIKMVIGSANGEKQSCYLPLHESAISKKYDYALCPLFNYPRVIDGRLYPCCLMPEVKHLNAHFGANIEIDKDDSLDLAKVNDYEEIRDFLSKRPHLCSYCALRERIVKDGWSSSERKKEEWFIVKNE